MGVPGLLKLLQMYYIDFNSGYHDNEVLKRKIFDSKKNIEIFFDFNSLLYLLKSNYTDTDYKIDNLINNINSKILDLLFQNIIDKKNYNTFIFLDGVPSYNKILNQKKYKFLNLVENSLKFLYIPKPEGNKEHHIFCLDKNKNNKISYNISSDILQRTFKPGTYIFEKIIYKIKNLFEKKYNLKYISSTSENDEGEIKLLRYMKYKYNFENKNNKDVIKIVLSPDADLIIQLIIFKLRYKVDNIFLCMIKKSNDDIIDIDLEKEDIINIEYISIDNITQQMLNTISYIYNNITCNHNMYKIMKLNNKSIINLNDNDNKTIYKIKKNKIDNSIQIFNITDNKYDLVNKIFFNNLIYGINNDVINLQDYIIIKDNTNDEDIYELIINIKISGDKKLRKYNMVNNDNILYYIMYYNDNIIYNNDDYVKKFIDNMEDKIDICYNNMLCDILFLLTFYGNDFTSSIQCMNIECRQSFISLFIIYIRSFIEYNKDDINDIKYLTIDNSCFFSNKNDNDNDFFKIILIYLNKYEILYNYSSIPDMIEEKNIINDLYTNLRSYNMNRYKYIYNLDNDRYDNFMIFYKNYYKFYNYFKENKKNKENTIEKIYEDYYHNNKDDIQFLIRYNKRDEIKINNYNNEEYLLLLQWLYNSYYNYNINFYVHYKSYAPKFCNLLVYLNNKNNININKFDTINHYKLSKFEQYINQSNIIIDSNNNNNINLDVELFYFFNMEINQNQKDKYIYNYINQYLYFSTDLLGKIYDNFKIEKYKTNIISDNINNKCFYSYNNIDYTLDNILYLFCSGKYTNSCYLNMNYKNEIEKKKDINNQIQSISELKLKKKYKNIEQQIQK